MQLQILNYTTIDTMSYDFERIRRLNEKLHSSEGASSSGKCSLCTFNTSSAELLKNHVNTVHNNTLEPSAPQLLKFCYSYFNCPLCFAVFSNSSDLEFHVDKEHEDILGPKENTPKRQEEVAPNNVCPVCNIYSSKSVKELSEHVNNHFSEASANKDFPPIPDLIDDDDCFLFKKITENGIGRLENKIKSRYEKNENRKFSLCEEVRKCESEKESTNNNIEWMLPVISDARIISNSQMNESEELSSTEIIVVDDDKDIAIDHLLAQQLSQEEEGRLKKESEEIRRREEKEFKRLQEEYGINSSGDFISQSVSDMQSAVVRGKMTVADFYQQKYERIIAEHRGLDDGLSCIPNIIPSIEAKSISSANVSETFLCSNIDFYSSSYGDKGWGCGYRNFQMLLSSFLRNREYYAMLSHHVKLFGIKRLDRYVPSISKLQEMIEAAWAKGFDLEGQRQLGRVCKTRHWIGATEIITVLSSFEFRCELIDIPENGHRKVHSMFKWVMSYFQKSETFKPPLFLQHQGHSRTIVGVEILQNDEVVMLIVDPSITKNKMDQLHLNPRSTLRMLRESIDDFKHKEYQIMAVVGLMKSNSEYEASKVLRSTRL